VLKKLRVLRGLLYLRSGDERDKKRGIELLQYGDVRAAQRITPFLYDPDWGVRRAAINTLVKFGGDIAIKPIYEALKSEEEALQTKIFTEAEERPENFKTRVPSLVGSNLRRDLTNALTKLGWPQDSQAQLMHAITCRDWETAAAFGKISYPYLIVAALRELEQLGFRADKYSFISTKSSPSVDNLLLILGSTGDRRALIPLQIARANESAIHALGKLARTAGVSREVLEVLLPSAAYNEISRSVLVDLGFEAEIRIQKEKDQLARDDRIRAEVDMLLGHLTTLPSRMSNDCYERSQAQGTRLCDILRTSAELLSETQLQRIIALCDWSGRVEEYDGFAVWNQWEQSDRPSHFPERDGRITLECERRLAAAEIHRRTL
jgi:hypothetical protein